MVWRDDDIEVLSQAVPPNGFQQVPNGSVHRNDLWDIVSQI